MGWTDQTTAIARSKSEFTCAGKTGALLVGLGVVDEPTIRQTEPRLIAAGVPYAEPIMYRQRIASARREVELFLAE